MPFKFSLAPVFEQRRALEEKAQREYAPAMERVEAVRCKRAQLEEELAARKRQVLQAQQSRARYIQRELIENWIKALQHETRAVEHELHRLMAQAEPLRLKLLR